MSNHKSKLKSKLRLISPPFRRGYKSFVCQKDAAKFQIQMNEIFLHIRSFPVRDSSRIHKETLEVSQDATYTRNLEGQKRLLASDMGDSRTAHT